MLYSPETLARYKWPVTMSRKIAASPQRIWSVISSPENLNECHPFCEKNVVTTWPGVGSIDTIQYYNGLVLKREFTTWQEGVGYDLTISSRSRESAYVSWHISGDGEESGLLSITVYSHVLQKVPLIVRWLPHLTTLRPNLQRYLSSVVRGFEWFITTGKPVSKNQFGNHKWFSVE